MKLSLDVILLIWFLDDVLADVGCPKLDLEGRIFNESDYSQNNFIPYRYYFSDPSVVSPFYVAEGSLIFFQKYHLQNTKQIQNYCEIDEDDSEDLVSNFLDIKYTLDDSGTKMSLVYEKNTLFCEPGAPQLSELTIFDVVPQRSLSLYGCQELLKNGQKIKFEGILVLATEDDEDLEISTDRDYLKKTFEIISNQIGIKVEQLSKYKNDMTTDNQKGLTCKDIQAKIKSCEGKNESTSKQ